MAGPGRPPPEVDWDSLDKRRFLVNGIGLFTGVTTCLYPLTVIKTRQMALADEGMLSAVRKLARAEGMRGLVRCMGLIGRCFYEAQRAPCVHHLHPAHTYFSRACAPLRARSNPDTAAA